MHTNRLVHEKSPYLLQHAHNPVDWYAWGDEAFSKARIENKPIFLSVGYSTCHWCHVMERESFESAEIAEVLNRDFISVKVDREERPDVDRVYMLFVQATTGGGGWPMSVWLTPALEPFFGGTYFPPDNRYGRPGFQAILEHIAQLWNTEGDRIRQSGGSILAQLRQHAEVSSGRGGIDEGAAKSCFYTLRRSYDSRFGGFGGAPKFPRPAAFHFLLRYWDRERDPEALDMTLATLAAMARGGMYDQLGGGFHRYSVDERWFVPHFEKMLYDQAQLAISYLEAYQISGQAGLAETARGILDYVLRDLTHPEGGFYSAEDADSVIDSTKADEKGEGAFYVWSRTEIGAVLGEPAASSFAEQYGVRDGGNVDSDPHGEFTGKNILFQAKDAAMAPEWRRRLLEARARRVRPHLDDKILAGWNGLMISAFAKAAQVLDDDRYGEAARRAAQFLRDRLFDASTGRVRRRFRDGEAAIDGFLDDYACVAQAFLDLYETFFELSDLRMAERLVDGMIERFADREHGGFFNTQEGDPNLLLRMKEDYDGAEPTGNSVAALTMLRLADMLGRDDFRDAAMRIFDAFSTRLNTAAIALPQMLSAWLFATGPRQQVVLAGARDGADTREMLRVVRRQFASSRVVLLVDSSGAPEHAAAWLPELVAMKSSSSEATAYVCENHTCRLPVHDPAALSRELERSAG